jgi:SsrA-binding protein
VGQAEHRLDATVAPVAGGRDGVKVVARNRRARHDYDVLDTLECGIVLQGSEVKSLRTAKVQLKDAYAYVQGGEVWLKGVHVAPYSHSHGDDGHDPERERKLLLHRSQIEHLRARVEREHLTLVPLSIHFRDARAKVELGLVRGRKRHDKRRALAERDVRREVDRAMADGRRGR